VVAIVCFFPIVVNAVDGLRSSDRELARMMSTLDGSRAAIFRRVELPGALPAIFSGARIATYAAVGAVFGEWAGSSAGLGLVMLQSQPALDTARIFACVFILSALALALYGLVSLTERLIVPWHRKHTDCSPARDSTLRSMRPRIPPRRSNSSPPATPTSPSPTSKSSSSPPPRNCR
jgi:putative hydroxymethylpyrimidine transport system permease protein